MIIDNLAKELAAFPHAVIIPLGKITGEVIGFLHERKLIHMERCLMNFPHPSGANGHRKPLYNKGRKQWRSQLQTWFA